MLRLIIGLLILMITNPVYADFITTGNRLGSNNAFRSKLKMNQPKVEIISPGRRNNNYWSSPYNRRRPCLHCQPRNYYNPYRYQSNIPAHNLNALEQYAFNRNYNRDNDINRLERLENLAFGAIQSGNPETRYKNVEAAILNRPNTLNTKRTVLGTLANYFTGQTTGFTPTISPSMVPAFQQLNGGFTVPPAMSPLGGYSNYPNVFSQSLTTPRYNNTKYEEYSNGIFGSGYGVSGDSYGSGSSVRILD